LESESNIIYIYIYIQVYRDFETEFLGKERKREWGRGRGMRKNIKITNDI